MGSSVKDKDNILDTNLWSGGDYTKSITPSSKSQSAIVTVSPDYANNGDYSIKITKTGDTTIVRFDKECLTEYIFKTLTASMMIYTPLDSLAVRLQQIDSTENILDSVAVNVPQNNQFTSNILSSTILENTTILRISINNESSSYAYFDNFDMKVQ